MADALNQRDTLRKRAERLLRRNPERISGISGKSVPELVHDLAVHQIELELQQRDRKRTEAQLRESEERYRVAIENSNDGVALVRGDRHIYVNRKFLEIFGYRTPEEVVGKTHYLTVHPDDREKVVSYNRRRQAGEAVPDRYEFKGIRKDGTPIYLEASVAGITYRGEPASLAYLRDITQRKHAERALQESETKFRLLFEKSADPILLLDGDTYVDCNEAALSLVACSSKEQLVGLHPWDISPTRQPDGRLSSEKVKELTDATMRQGTNQFEWMRRTFDGEEFWVEVSHTVIPIRGRQIIYNVWRDIRERKQAEAQLRESEERYRVAIENSNDGVVLIRGETILYANRRLLDMMGYGSAAEVVGRNVGLAVHPDDYEKVTGYARTRERENRRLHGTNSEQCGRTALSSLSRHPFPGSPTRASLPHSGT